MYDRRRGDSPCPPEAPRDYVLYEWVCLDAKGQVVRTRPGHPVSNWMRRMTRGVRWVYRPVGSSDG
jgi:hypothetical protein